MHLIFAVIASAFALSFLIHMVFFVWKLLANKGVVLAREEDGDNDDVALVSMQAQGVDNDLQSPSESASDDLEEKAVDTDNQLIMEAVIPISICTSSLVFTLDCGPPSSSLCLPWS
jgi:hypothetical protein